MTLIYQNNLHFGTNTIDFLSKVCYNGEIESDFPLSRLVFVRKEQKPIFTCLDCLQRSIRFIDKSCTSYLLNKIIESGGNPNEENYLFVAGCRYADERSDDVGIRQHIDRQLRPDHHRGLFLLVGFYCLQQRQGSR